MSEYGGKVEFAVQDFGASPLADRFGIDKYPAVFVDNALVARPEDFYAWNGPGDGKYIPFTEAGGRKRFQIELRRLIDVRLAGGTVGSSAAGEKQSSTSTLPAVQLQDLDGHSFNFAALRGKPVVVEIWATWCPLCLQTFSWLKNLESKKVNVVSIAVESPRPDIDKVISQFKPAGRIVMASDEVVEAFGNVPAIPRMFIADANGRIVKTFIGAPPDLREQVLHELAKLQ